MNTLDGLIMLAALLLGVRGFRKGLVQEGLEAFSALSGIFAAYATHRELGAALSIYTGLPVDVTGPVLFAVVATAVTAAGFLITMLIKRIVPREGIAATFDGLGGLGFGLLKGLFYASLLLVLVAQAPVASVTRALDGSAISRAVFASLPHLYEQVEVFVEQAPGGAEVELERGGR